MNDDEVANELGRVAGAMFSTAGPWPDWPKVASRARELLTQELIAARLLPEERAVIEAADAWAKRYICEPSSYGEPAASLLTAVRRLRESQTPKPRYRVGPSPVGLHLVRDTRDMHPVCEASSQEDAENIANALNYQ